MRYLGFVNIMLALGLVGMAIWLYGQEHGTRQWERQIHELKRATALEEETSRRLEVEWQALQRPDRLEALARERLDLGVPDPAVVVPLDQMLARLPSRASLEGASAEARQREEPLGDAPPRRDDVLGALIEATEGVRP